jgi:hypothetical protein
MVHIQGDLGVSVTAFFLGGLSTLLRASVQIRGKSHVARMAALKKEVSQLHPSFRRILPALMKGSSAST